MYQAAKKRTTVEFDESVLAQVKELCAQRGETLSAFVQDAVQRRLNERTAKREFKLHTVKALGPRPGVNIDSNVALQELLDEGKEIDELR